MRKVLLNIIFIFVSFLFFGQTKIISFYFENDQIIPTAYSRNQLMLFKQSLKKGDLTILEICSYTDSIGSNQYNDSLAKKRLAFTTIFLEITHNSYVKLQPYGLNRKYDVKNFKNWRRVDIYYVLGQVKIKNDIPKTTVEKIDPVQKTTINDTILEIIESKEIVVEEKPSILNVEFVEGTAKMELKSYSEVDKLAGYLKSHPEESILICGHVCCGKNMRISRNRAKEVYKQLIKQGIPKERLDFKGMSNKEPLAFPEKTPEDRQRNRRVDVKFN